MKLITETYTDNVKSLVEDVQDPAGIKRNYYITGVFMESENRNRNGRIYPKHLIEREVNRYGTNYISENRAFGELDHPDTPTINLDRVSHLIKDLHFEGNIVYGKAKIMDTPCGKIVKNFIDEGSRLGVSSRGVGSLKKMKDYDLVGEDFFLSTVDIVADPSAKTAFVNGIMEGRNWDLLNGVWTCQDYDTAKKILKESSRKEYEAKTLSIFSNFIKKL